MGTFCDSFMKYDTSARVYRWNISGGGVSLLPTGGRTVPVTRGAMRIINNNSAIKTLVADADWSIGVAVQFANLFNGDFLKLLDGGSSQLVLSLRTDGTFVLQRGSTTVDTSSFAFFTDTWYYLEWISNIDNTTGSSELQVNGVSVLSFAGDTQATTNSTANAFELAGEQAAADLKFADLFVRYGADVTGFLGDKVVEGLSPDADGALAAWAISTGVLTYAVLDESSPSMTDYISSTTPTDRSTVTYPSIGVAAGTINLIQQTIFADKDDGGVRQVEQFTRIGGVNYDTGNIHSLSGETFYEDQWTLNPATGLAWTVAEANAFEGGVELVA